MDLRKEDLPATLQAFDLQDEKEIFIAEQVVNSQAEVELFTTRYVGKLIKAKKALGIDTNGRHDTTYPLQPKKRSSTTGLIMFIIILLLVFLVVYGFSTGWIQEKFNLKI